MGSFGRIGRLPNNSQSSKVSAFGAHRHGISRHGMVFVEVYESKFVASPFKRFRRASKNDVFFDGLPSGKLT